MRQALLSEEDFDSAPHQASDPSPDINLGSHLPNPLFPNGKVPSSMTLPLGGAKVPSTEKSGAGLLERRDRINNVTQKEEAMLASGVTRRRTYDVIYRLLSSEKWVSTMDSGGNMRDELVPDLEKQARGAELALKTFGDMIEHKTMEYGIADSTLEALKKLSVAELRLKAAALLARRAEVVDVSRAEDGVVVK